MEKLAIECVYMDKKVPTLNSNLNVKYQDGYLYFLMDENNKRVSNYYSNIVSLNIPDYYRVTILFKVNRRKIRRYKVIKLKRDEEGKIIPKEEEFITKDYFQYIKNGEENTLLVGYNGLYTYLDIDPESPSYMQYLYPLIFNYASSFNVERKRYAKVKIGTKTGYIKRPINPVLDINEKDLISEEEIDSQEEEIKKSVKELEKVQIISIN